MLTVKKIGICFYNISFACLTKKYVNLIPSKLEFYKMPKALTLLNSNITYFFLTNLVHKVQVLSLVKNKINLFWRLDVEKSNTAQKMKISIKDFFS